MEIKLNNEAVSCWQAVLDTAIAQEETAELTVPDSMPDIQRIVRAEGQALMKSKVTDTGRAVLSGVVSVSVLYCPEGTEGVRRIGLELPYTCACSDASIDGETTAVAVTEAVSVQAAVSGPRRAAVRVELLTNLTCFRKTELETNQSAPDGTALELYKQSRTVLLPVSVTEKTAVLSEEFDVTDTDLTAAEVLCGTVRFEQRDQKVVGSRLVMRALEKVTVLLRSGQTVRQRELEREFSQIIELDSASEEDVFSLCLMPSSAYFQCTQGAAEKQLRLLAEVQTVIQCVQKQRLELAYVTDASAVGKQRFEPLTQTVTLPVAVHTQETTELLAEVLDTPEKAAQVLSVRAGCSRVTAAEEAYSAAVAVSILYTDAQNRLQSVTRRFEVKCARTQEEQTKTSARIAELYAAPGAGGIDLRMTVCFTSVREETAAVQTVTGGELTERTQKDERSVVLRRAAAGETLWQIAKQYATTEQSIREANDADARGIQPGDLLLIPLVKV